MKLIEKIESTIFIFLFIVLFPGVAQAHGEWAVFALSNFFILLGWIIFLFLENYKLIHKISIFLIVLIVAVVTDNLFYRFRAKPLLANGLVIFFFYSFFPIVIPHYVNKFLKLKFKHNHASVPDRD